MLTVAVFAMTAWLTIRLSFPPDPLARRYLPTPPPPTQVTTDRDTLTVREDRDTRRYRFYRTDHGLVAREIPRDEEQPSR